MGASTSSSSANEAAPPVSPGAPPPSPGGRPVYQPGVRGLLAFAAERRTALFGAFLLVLVADAATLAQPIVTGRLLDAVVAGRQILWIILLLVAIFLIGAILTGVGGYVLSRTGEAVVRDLRIRLGAHLLYMRIAEHDQRRSGDLLSRASGDTMLLRSIVTTGPVTAITGSITLIASLVLMGRVDLTLLGATVGVLTVSFGSVFLILPRVKPAAMQTQASIGRLIAVLDRSLRAIRTVKASRAEQRELREIEVQAASAYDGGLKLSRIQSQITPAITLGVHGSFLVVLGVGGGEVATGRLTISQLITFLLYLTTLAVPLVSVGQLMSDLHRGLVSFNRVNDILNLDLEQTAVTDGAAGEGVPRAEERSPERELETVAHMAAPGETDRSIVSPPTGAPARPGGAAEITFEDVRFGYLERPILNGVSFQVTPGSHTAIVGPSGAGKSTVLALVERFYEADAGRVLVDGLDVTEVPLNGLRRMIAYVEQETPVLAGSVGDNIRYACPDADGDAVAAVVARVGLTGLVERLPEGLDTDVGDAGVLMSGGERQRIAIARALLGAPRVLLLDEATSQLDALNELAMRDTVRSVAGPSCTVVTVAHRLSTVVEADKIIVLAGGQVVGSGTHQELLADNEEYRDLVQGQLLSGAAGSAGADAELEAIEVFEDDDEGPEVLAAGADALEMWRAAQRGKPGFRWLGP
ncbi:ABC transporter ATP-binding protein [Streptomyces sp. CA-111067]|uniref:ABC transporter ATP-binding protein n=1 Tax=Streptomyces sp. CA-111067 TaxID=3240046 RepID=UPI003D98726D